MMVDIRGKLELSLAVRRMIARRLGFALDRFGARISAVTVWLSDVNGPRGGVDTLCRLKVALTAGRPVVVEARDASVPSVIAGAADRIARAVARELSQRRQLDGLTLRDLTARASRGF